MKPAVSKDYWSLLAMQCISKFYAETCWHTIFLQLYIQRSFLNLKV